MLLKNVLFILFSMILLTFCAKDNSNQVLGNNKPNNTNGCYYTSNIGYRSADTVRVIVTLHQNAVSFTNNYLRISLFEYNVKIADVPACLVDSVIIPVDHIQGDSLLFNQLFYFSHSDSLRYYFNADLFSDSTISNANRRMYTNPDSSMTFFFKADTIKINLLSL